MSVMVNETTREIARRLRGIRDARGVTDLDLSSHSGITRSSVQRYLSGLYDIPVTKLGAICAALEVTLESILRDLPRVAA